MGGKRGGGTGSVTPHSWLAWKGLGTPIPRLRGRKGQGTRVSGLVKRGDGYTAIKEMEMLWWFYVTYGSRGYEGFGAMGEERSGMLSRERRARAGGERDHAEGIISGAGPS